MEEIVYDDGIRPGKPAPDMYLEATHRLALDPTHCIVVEDSIAGIPAGIGHVVALGPLPTHAQLQQRDGVV